MAGGEWGDSARQTMCRLPRHNFWVVRFLFPGNVLFGQLCIVRYGAKRAKQGSLTSLNGLHRKFFFLFCEQTPIFRPTSNNTFCPFLSDTFYKTFGEMSFNAFIFVYTLTACRNSPLPDVYISGEFFELFSNSIRPISFD